MSDDVRRALEAFSEKLELHEAHTWKQVGRCVYCNDCSERLYQGWLPKDRKPPPTTPREPKATTEMRQRWGKL